MGRKSALTPDQWIEIERRIIVENESAFALAKEFGVNESSIRRKIKPNSADKAELGQKHHPDLRDLAIEKARADEQSRRISEKIAELPYARQQIVSDLSRRLVNISSSLASAAEHGAATAHRLSAIANAQVQKIDDENPMESQEVLQGISALTKMSNDASVIPMGLLAANRELMRKAEDESQTPALPVAITIERKSARAVAK